jgi:hypothetical protein
MVKPFETSATPHTTTLSAAEQRGGPIRGAWQSRRIRRPGGDLQSTPLRRGWAKQARVNADRAGLRSADHAVTAKYGRAHEDAAQHDKRGTARLLRRSTAEYGTARLSAAQHG